MTERSSLLLRNAIHAGVFVLLVLPISGLVDARTNFPHGVDYAITFFLALTLFNLLLLPRLKIGRLIARPGGGQAKGEWLYPLALAICFLLFPPFAALAAWATLAGGDAAAALAGRTLPWPRLPWNKNKSWAGLAAFALVAFPFAYLALYLCPSPQFLTSARRPELPFVWTLAVLASCCGAALESLAGPGDDNLRVPLGVGAGLLLAAKFLSWATRGLPAATHVQPEQFVNALAVNAVLGLAIFLLRFADWPGTLLGASLGVLVYFLANWQGYLLLALFVVMGCILSRIGRKEKEALGVAEPRGGKRGLSNVAANLAVPALCCLAYPAYGGHPAFLLAFAGALAAAMADTASSEIGVFSTRKPVLITTWRPVAHGVNGAVSGLGFFAATAGSALIASVAWESGFFQLIFDGTAATHREIFAWGIIVLAGLAGTVVDSLLGATIEDRIAGLRKGMVNFFCTLAGALVAGVLSLSIL